MKKISSHYLKWLLLFLANLSLLGGCVKQSSEEEKTLETSNVLKLNFLVGDIPSLHPHILPQGRSQCLGKWLFEGLARLAPSGKYELSGAEQVEISPCQKRYVFTLRSNCYCDGTPVSAYDYEAAWKKALTPGSACERAHLFYPIKNAEKAKKGEASLDSVGVKALDEKTLVVKLDRIVPYFLELLSMPLFAPYKVKGKEILGSGPYLVESRKKGRDLNLKANPFFWGVKDVKIKKIVISMILDGMTAFYLYKKGDLDWIGDPFSPLPEEVLSSKDLKDTWTRKEMIRPFWIYLNTQCFPLVSPAIRRAFNLVIDRKLISEHIYVGCHPLFKALPKQFSTLDDAIHVDDLNQGKAFFDQELKELGLTRETFPIITLSCSSVARHKKLAEYLKESWEGAFGIKLKLDVQEWNIFYKNLKEGNYQIGGSFTASDYGDPLALLTHLSSSINFSHWDHPLYQSTVESIKEEGNPTLRRELIKKAEVILGSESPIIGIFNQGLNYTYRSDLKGIVFDPSGMPDLRWAYFEDSP